ncbi:MAG: phenylalanine 4-monooxygenase [Acidobacteria bacterium]|nr:MAG: phenylalanine 4-monooxygenase [Acidobacteriota bacterium]
MRTGIVQLEADHPGFNDPEYRRRRDEIALLAREHDLGDPIPVVEYTEAETRTWATVFRELNRLFPTHACREYNDALALMGFSEDRIPQLAEVDRILAERTGFRIWPVEGLVEPRDFFDALARRVFPATQYIRHHSVPHYTPEPDTIHDQIGHVPMLAIREYADLTQKIGEGAHGATDDQIAQLARLYWYTIEFGVVRQDGELRCYGAGILSSYGEMARAVRAEEPEIRRFDPEQARWIDYPITHYQPILWEVDSIGEAFEMVARAVETIRAG